MAGVAAIASFLLISLVAFLLQIFLSSPISPEAFEPPPVLGDFTKNDRLQEVEKLGEGMLDGPEDVCVDKSGAIYTVTRDGWIKKMHKNQSWENWKMIAGPTLLGLTCSIAGDIIVCDADRGLLKVGQDGTVTLLASEVDGSRICFTEAVTEGRDGSIYFTDASAKYGYWEWHLDLLEARPHGRLLKFDPQTGRTSVVLDNLYFANGVALSRDQDFVVVCETWKFRCLRHWLTGERKTEVFVDNLPGAPDNINLAEDGTFWIALLEMRTGGKELIYSSKLFKHILVKIPRLLNRYLKIRQKAMVINVDADGKIINYLDDSTGKVISLVTSAVQSGDHLYLGNLNTKFIGRLALQKAKK
ncbi:protein STRICTOSIDINE SYNTHASE-LIKE 4-like isoform X1 [Nymphaea colorata]|nr:protein STRICTOSIDINE SYNTHASE-LIKE 4-like isoform X1 [Nymphaea colorata]